MEYYKKRNKIIMDLHQPHINSSGHSAITTSVVLLSPTTNSPITNNSIPTTAIVDNISTASSSPSTSSAIAVVNHHPSHHLRNSRSFVLQKTNQVSTVLLCDIPIVSLYIEGQARLCLAQISNTLLKQFSYNEIHNRRVALGITCVQCTPVQLEILRRAGAMPVSSRRCGMITRREAERLCKSFLGDNAPPRLPEDFAFNVQHKCSWGCKGSFLPSRYNSSRAKCIKCHYCGMFFSPNKFIFHSHRIGPGDKYVQPDAANFNSWRRHMILSGQPDQEVIYAWEDVKAMFNGGTRKRLLISSNSSPLSSVASSSPSSYSAGATSSNLSRDKNIEAMNEDPLLSNIPKNNNSVNTVTAAATVVGVTTVAVGSAVRPLNLHFQTSTSTGLAAESSYSAGTDMHLLPAAALSRSFMMDYMWQHAHQAAKNSQSQQYQQQHPTQQKVKSTNSAISLPWKNSTIEAAPDMPNHETHHSNTIYSSSVISGWPNTADPEIRRNLSEIINTSAFKPVMYHQHHQNKPVEITSPSTRSRRRHSTLQVSTYANDCNTQMLPNANQHPQNKFYNNFFSDEDENDGEPNSAHINRESPNSNSNSKQLTAHNSEVLDDDILVDIETTEDEKPASFSTNRILSTSRCYRFTIDSTESHHNIESNPLDNDMQAASEEDIIDVVHNENNNTVLELVSVTPATMIKYYTENDRKTLNAPSTASSPDVALIAQKELHKFYNTKRSSLENVISPSVFPNLNSSNSSY